MRATAITTFRAIGRATVNATSSPICCEALEPSRQGVRRCLGGCAEGVATELSLRHDQGSPYRSDVSQSELAFLGIASSPAFVRAPEGSVVVERFIRTLKEQFLWVRTFETVEDLRWAL